MRNINEIMPKIPGMKWGSVSNFPPTKANFKEMDRLLPHDKKWHMLFELPGEMIIDGISVRRKTLESMT